MKRAILSMAMASPAVAVVKDGNAKCQMIPSMLELPFEEQNMCCLVTVGILVLGGGVSSNADLLLQMLLPASPPDNPECNKKCVDENDGDQEAIVACKNENDCGDHCTFSPKFKDGTHQDIVLGTCDPIKDWPNAVAEFPQVVEKYGHLTIMPSKEAQARLMWGSCCVPHWEDNDPMHYHDGKAFDPLTDSCIEQAAQQLSGSFADMIKPMIAAKSICGAAGLNTKAECDAWKNDSGVCAGGDLGGYFDKICNKPAPKEDKDNGGDGEDEESNAIATGLSASVLALIAFMHI